MIHSAVAAPRPALAGFLGDVCADLGFDPELCRSLLADDAVRRLDPETDAPTLGAALAMAACRNGAHGAEAALGAWLVASVDGLDALREAWLVRLDGLRHLMDAASAAGTRSEVEDETRGAVRSGVGPRSLTDAAERLRGAAIEAFEALDGLVTAAEVTPAQRRTILDPITARMASAEAVLSGPSSAVVRDLERRIDARGVALPGTTLRDKHGDAIREIARRDGRAWWFECFVDKFGVEPPDDWWLDDPDAPAGGRVSHEHLADQWFDRGDEAAFADEMEARFRLEAELPVRGEGRVGQPHLRHCVAAVLPGVPIVEEASPEWLGRQRLDLFLPSLGVAIEYQGEQHYIPLPHWNGEEGLAARRELDERKRDACTRAGVRLLEWRYDEPVSVAAVRRRLERAGILEPD